MAVDVSHQGISSHGIEQYHGYWWLGHQQPVSWPSSPGKFWHKQSSCFCRYSYSFFLTHKLKLIITSCLLVHKMLIYFITDHLIWSFIFNHACPVIQISLHLITHNHELFHMHHRNDMVGVMMNIYSMVSTSSNVGRQALFFYQARKAWSMNHVSTHWSSEGPFTITD